MSGGKWQYRHFELHDAVRDIARIVAENDEPEGRHYSPAVLAELCRAAVTMRLAALYWGHIDYLECGDYDETSFLSRVAHDVNTTDTGA